LYLEENTYLYENILIKILVNVIGIIVILFIAYQAININYGLNQSIETGIKKFNEIELGDSLDDVKKIANRSIEGEENTYSGLTTITFNINAMKEYSIKVVFQHEDKNDSSSKLVCVSRKLDCDEDVLADKNVSFDNFETLKEKCEKASYDYYFSSSDLLKTYKSYSDYHEENKVTLDDVSEYLLSDGILKEEESWTNTKTTVFADSDGNYISVTSTDSVVSKIEGKVNGEKISVSAHY
jgi:hypothetical protein